MKLFNILVIFTILTILPVSIYAENNSTKNPSRGITFLAAYDSVDEVLKGNKGLRNEIHSIAITEAKNGVLYFLNLWFDFSVAYCIKNIDTSYIDMKDKQKAQKQMDEALAICYQKYILDNWDLINESIKNRYHQLSDPEYFKKLIEKMKEAEKK